MSSNHGECSAVARRQSDCFYRRNQNIALILYVLLSVPINFSRKVRNHFLGPL